MTKKITNVINNGFGVDELTFIESINDPKNASAKGSILGAISEVLLQRYLKKKKFKTHRIKEKPDGGFDKKNNEARGDFYIKDDKEKNNKWLVVECKGLKSNSEKHAHNFYERDKCFTWLKNKLKKKTKKDIYEKGYQTYLRNKKGYEKLNPSKEFLKFTWNKDYPGLENYDLDNLWKDETGLLKWINSLPNELFKKENVDIGKGSISILMTHMPSTRTSSSGIKSTGPLKGEFGILAVDLFYRTGKHEFVFASSNDLSHQPGSPEHLSQNYTIDIMPFGLKTKPVIQFPWYKDINECIENNNLIYREIDTSQIDNRY